MDAEYTDKLLSTVSAAATSAAQDPLVSLHAVYDAIIKGDFEAIGEFIRRCRAKHRRISGD